MKKKESIVDQVPGTDVNSQEEYTSNQIQEWAKKDLMHAIGFLNALYTDPDLLAHLATFIAGRISNDKLKKELGKQPKLFED